MNKVLKLLHKKDIKIKDESRKKHIKNMEEVFKFDKISYSFKEEFSFYKNEILYNGILNKLNIEKSYRQGKLLMEDYYDTLVYEQKKLLMNYEIHKQLESCMFFNYQDQNIYIPFFDLKMNNIYENEMVLFDIKKYSDLMLKYDHLIDLNQYGYMIYNSSFSSLDYIYEENDECSLYSKSENRLYLLKNYEFNDFITLPLLENNQYIEISKAYFSNDVLKLIELLYEYKCIDDKVYKKLTKNRK